MHGRVPWSLAGRLLARDWRSGEVVVLLVALVVGVAAMSSVGFFTDRVRQAVTAQAGESLAADLRLGAATPLPEAYDAEARARGLQTARVTHFRSVVLAGDASALAHVRGVTAGYPLRGEVHVADGLTAPPRAARGIPRVGEVWAEPSLLARLGIDVGDVIEVGTLTLLVGQTLEFRPDEGWRFMQIAPTLLLNLEDVHASGLLQPGSIAQYEALYAGGERVVTAFRRELEPRLGPNERLEDFRDARPEVRTSVQRAERFLILSALVSVLLGGVAVAMAARRFVARRLDGVALMKCLGARHRDVLRLNLTQLVMLIAAAALVGSLLGYVAQFGLSALLADFVEARLPPASARAAVLGPLAALVVAVGCVLPPLLQLGTVPPARVLRQDLGPPRLRYLTVYGVAAAAVTGLLYLLFRDVELISYVIAGTVLTFGALYLAGRLLVMALERVRGGAGVAWRYGIANVARRGRESSVQVVAFGIGLMVLLLLTLVRTELMVEWQATLPENAANHFLINIQPHERELVSRTLAAHGIAEPEYTPLVRARITHVNGTPVAEVETGDRRARRELTDEINLTWMEHLTPDNEVTRGHWWTPGDTRPQLSIEEELLEELELAIGDELTYFVGGESVTLEITNARRVQWDSFRPNFFMVASPGAFDEFAHTYLTSFHARREDRAATLALARALPSVSVIDIEAVLDQVRNAMDRAALAVQYVFLFTLAAGVIVMLAAVQATREERMYESAVLRTLGARRGTVLQGVASEFVALGLLAGWLAAVGAGGIGYYIAARMFELSYTPGPGLWLAGMAAGALLVGVSGTLAVRSVVNESPVTTLRRA
jgi:putative ABC transport system permease protein